MTLRLHISGDVHVDRTERFPSVLYDTGCTLIRKYAPRGKPHAYAYTLTINEAGRHFHRDTFYLTVDPYHRNQTVYDCTRTGRVQLFTQQSGKSLVVSAFNGVLGLHLRFNLSPDLRSGTVEARNMQASKGGAEGLRASLTPSWTCPVLFQEHWG